jgi:hypothetical protein
MTSCWRSCRFIIRQTALQVIMIMTYACGIYTCGSMNVYDLLETKEKK